MSASQAPRKSTIERVQEIDSESIKSKPKFKRLETIIQMESDKSESISGEEDNSPDGRNKERSYSNFMGLGIRRQTGFQAP